MREARLERAFERERVARVTRKGERDEIFCSATHEGATEHLKWQLRIGFW